MYADPLKKIFSFDYSTMAVGCDRKLYWGRKLGLKKVKAGEPAFFGKALHKFVEHFWLGKDYDICIGEYYKLVRSDESPMIDDPEDPSSRTVQRGQRVCMHYFKNYYDLRSNTKILEVSGHPLVEVPFAFPLATDQEGWSYVYCGRMDRVEIRDGEVLWIVDTKHTTRFGSTYWNTLRPNDQITGYAAGLREIVGKLPNFYAIDVIAIGEPREKVPKALRDVPQDQIDLYLENVRFEQGPTTRTAEDVHDWWENAMVEGIRMRKLWESENMVEWAKRTSQCGSYGGCDFRDLCAVTSNFEPIRKTLYEVRPWSPFVDESASGEHAPAVAGG